MTKVWHHNNEKKRLIFSIFTKITDTTKKRTDNQKQFEIYYKDLVRGLADYAKTCNADYILLSPEVIDYDNLNVYKIQQWEKLLDEYDNVMYLDFDIIPNTTRNIFEEFDFNKVVTRLLPVNDYLKQTGFKAPGESFTDFYERTKLKEYQEQKKELDQYHWLIKGQQKKDMFKADSAIGCKDVIANTGTFGGNRNARDTLKFSERLDHCKKLIDSIKHLDDRYFYNNEIIVSFMLDRYNVPTIDLPPHWHELVLTDTPMIKLKYSYLIHVITKDFKGVYKVLNRDFS